jgi:hypothetical protein
MEVMKEEAGLSALKLLRADGGASHNSVLMQMQADALTVRPHPRQAIEISNIPVWKIETSCSKGTIPVNHRLKKCVSVVLVVIY